MGKRVLVAFASKRGGTEEIARKIGETIRKKGIEADVLPAGEVGDLSPYGSVVLGSSVYIGFWRKEAVRFLRENEKRLSELPVWIFSSGPTGPGDPLELVGTWRFPESIRSSLERIRPRDVTCFGGKLEMSFLNPFEKMIVRRVNAAAGDFRNWDTVASWARSIGD